MAILVVESGLLVKCFIALVKLVLIVVILLFLLRLIVLFFFFGLFVKPACKSTVGSSSSKTLLLGQHKQARWSINSLNYH